MDYILHIYTHDILCILTLIKMSLLLISTIQIPTLSACRKIVDFILLLNLVLSLNTLKL